MAINDSKKLKPDFVLAGGDMVFDAADQGLERAKKLYGLLDETLKRLDAPLHTCPGNHDVFGTSAKSGVSKTQQGWGKKMFEDHIGPRYHSFHHKGWHFIVLDSIEITPEGGYRGAVDSEQLNWLKADISKAGNAPTVVLTHIPLLTAAVPILGFKENMDSLIVSNAKEVIEILAAGNVKMVLQGHTHICETVDYKGCQYITSGAVCGNWWKGQRLGFSEGYGVIHVRGDRAEWSYRSYGFQAQLA